MRLQAAAHTASVSEFKLTVNLHGLQVDDFLIVQFLLEQPHAHYFRHNDLILLTSEEPSVCTSHFCIDTLPSCCCSSFPYASEAHDVYGA